MTTYNTGNPIGSPDPRDLYDNAQVIDDYANSAGDTTSDRLGVERRTLAGMEGEFDTNQADRASEYAADKTSRDTTFDADQADRVQRFNALLAASGYVFLADYAAGLVVSEYNEVIRDTAGNLWRASAGTDLPYTTTGAGLPEGGAFVSAGDAVLRNDLAAGVAIGQGALLVRGSVIYVDTIADLQALPGEELVSGQIASVAGEIYRFSGSEFVQLSGASPLAFGAAADGVSDDTAALQAAIDTGLCLLPNASIAYTNITIPHGAVVIGQGIERSRLVCIGTTGDSVRVADAERWRLAHFSIVGTGGSSSDTGHNGLVLSSDKDDSSLYANREWSIDNLRIESFGGTGLVAEKLIKPGQSWGRTGVISGLQIRGCYRGYFFKDRGEYISIFGMHVWSNVRAGEVVAGNNKFIGCQFDNNTNGPILNSGINDHHGSFVGCSFNHNANLALWVQSSIRGQTFTDCAFFDGILRIDNAKGIIFNGGYLAMSQIDLRNNTGSITFNDMQVREDSNNTLTQTGANEYQFINCRDRNGWYPGNTMDTSLHALSRSSDLSANGVSPRTLTWTVYDAKVTGGNDNTGKISGNKYPIPETGLYMLTVAVEYSISGEASKGVQRIEILKERDAAIDAIATQEMSSVPMGSAGQATALVYLNAGDLISSQLYDSAASDGTRAVVASPHTYWSILLASKVPQ